MSFNNREDFLQAAGLFEFALLLLGIILGWIFSVSPVEHFHWTWSAAMWGALAGAGLFLLVTGIENLPIDAIKSIQDSVIEIIGRPLSQCNWFELGLLALLAGIGEEVLFRGFMMNGIELIGGYWVALAISSLVFGFVHSVTWTYTLFATAAGLFLGYLFDATGTRNLLVPIVAHSLYDFLAFVIIAREAKKVYGDNPPIEQESETDNEFEW